MSLTFQKSDPTAPLGYQGRNVSDVDPLPVYLVGGGGGGGSTAWADITEKPEVIAAGATQAEARTAVGAGTSNLVVGSTAGTAPGTAAAGTSAQAARADHVHPSPIPAGGSATTFLRGDNTWVLPTNTTYAVLTAAVVETGTATTAQSISAKVLADEVERRITVRVPAPPGTGSFTLQSVEGVVSWVATP